jgi:hypothetical protein
MVAAVGVVVVAAVGVVVVAPVGVVVAPVGVATPVGGVADRSQEVGPADGNRPAACAYSTCAYRTQRESRCDRLSWSRADISTRGQLYGGGFQ